MTLFLGYFVGCLPIGFFIVLLCTSGIKSKIKRIISLIVATLIVTSIFAFGFILEEYGDKKIYNDGKCSCCNGNYHFVNASKHKQSTTYYYECDNCGHIIELGSAQ